MAQTCQACTKKNRQELFGGEGEHVRLCLRTTRRRCLRRDVTTKLTSSRPLDYVFKFSLLGYHLHQLLSSGCAWVGSGGTQSDGRRIAVYSRGLKSIFCSGRKSPLYSSDKNRPILFFSTSLFAPRCGSLAIEQGHCQPRHVRMKSVK